MNRIVREDCEAIIAALGDRLDGLAGSRVLVTGSNGFLCSYLVDTIALWNDVSGNARCHVIAMDNLLTGTNQRLAHLQSRDDIEMLAHDVNEPFPDLGRIDRIVHGASIASPTTYRRNPLATLDANIGGTRHALDLARKSGARGVLVMSSSEIYGNPHPDSIPTPETYPGFVASIGPRACYDESKRVSETLSYIYRTYFDVPVRVIRPFNVYGPGQRLDDGRIIPDLMSAALGRKPIRLFSDGTATRSFCYVADATRAMLALLMADSLEDLAFNVGNDETEISMRDLADLMCSVASAVTGFDECRVEFATSDDANYTTDNPERRAPDLSRIRTAVGFAPETGLREGLSRTLSSYIDA